MITQYLKAIYTKLNLNWNLLYLTQTEFQDKSRTFSTILFKLKDMKDPEISMSYERNKWL